MSPDLAARGQPLDIFMIAGETSGDELGAAFMRAARARFGDASVTFRGVGGEAMMGEGLQRLFDMRDITAMGLNAVIAGLPRILRRMRETKRALADAPPDLLLTIDSPDFCLRVGKALRRRHPKVPIVHWVCPSVWAWRQWRAKSMRPHVDEILCLLPFEPEALARLSGPPGTYTGHPLIERLPDLTPNAEEATRRSDTARPEIVVLPGSRRSETRPLLPIFADVIGRLKPRWPAMSLTLPTLPHLRDEIEAAVTHWPVRPRVVIGEVEKYAAFRRARAALAASGTVSLELGLACLPTVIAYSVGRIESIIGKLVVRVPSVVLANLVLGENVMPEFIMQNCRADRIAPALEAILVEGPARENQIAQLSRLPAIMSLGHDQEKPSLAAVSAVADFLARRGLGVAAR